MCNEKNSPKDDGGTDVKNKYSGGRGALGRCLPPARCRNAAAVNHVTKQSHDPTLRLDIFPEDATPEARVDSLDQERAQ